MSFDDQTYERGGKTYRRVLMRNSFRSGGRVCHETVANLSTCTAAEIEAIKLAPKHKGRLEILDAIPDGTRTRQGLPVGALFLLHQLAKRLGVVRALGIPREAKLDGCYVIKTDLCPKQADAETVHERCKDLSEVEWAFRTMKTVLLEMRGIFVRKAERTRAHVVTRKKLVSERRSP